METGRLRSRETKQLLSRDGRVGLALAPAARSALARWSTAQLGERWREDGGWSSQRKRPRTPPFRLTIQPSNSRGKPFCSLSRRISVRIVGNRGVPVWKSSLMLHRITNEYLMRQSIREQVLERPRPYPASPAWKGPTWFGCQKWGGLFLSSMFVFRSKKSRASPLGRCGSDRQVLTWAGPLPLALALTAQPP